MSPSYRVKFVTPDTPVGTFFLHCGDPSSHGEMTADQTLATQYADRNDACEAMKLCALWQVAPNHQPLPFIIMPDAETHCLLVVVDQDDKIQAMSVWKQGKAILPRQFPTTFAQRFRGGVN